MQQHNSWLFLPTTVLPLTKLLFFFFFNQITRAKIIDNLSKSKAVTRKGDL